MSTPDALLSSSSPEWYTPDTPYLQAVRACLGHIELDPASCEVANRVVQAERIFTITDNGLSRTWDSEVYLNTAKDNQVCQCQCHKHNVQSAKNGNLPLTSILVLDLIDQKESIPNVENVSPGISARNTHENEKSTGTIRNRRVRHPTNTESTRIDTTQLNMELDSALSAGNGNRSTKSTLIETGDASQASTLGVKTAVGTVPKSEWQIGVTIHSKENALRLRNGDTINPARAESESGSNRKSTTIYESPGSNQFQPSGRKVIGSNVSEHGITVVPTAEKVNVSHKITSFPSAIPSALEPYRGILSRLACHATPVSKIDPHSNGVQINSDFKTYWITSHVCNQCHDCCLVRYPTRGTFLNSPYGYEGAPDKRKNGEWNPRLGRPNQRIWSQKLIDEHKAGNVMQAIMLCNAQTGENWFQPLWAYPICFVDHRIPFYTVGANGDVTNCKNGKSGPTHASVFVYFGPWEHRFETAFRHIGKFRWPNSNYR